jgi:hypothetical protein
LEFEPDVDPPPDLILEVDVTTSSFDQLELYAAMRVPEVWIHDGKSLQFLILNRRSKFEDSERSQAFPFLAPGDFERFLKRHAAMDETSLVREFVAVARRKYEQWQRVQEKATKLKRAPKGRKK